MSTNITLTEAAARRIREILAIEPGEALRVSVSGGGCSGFQYDFKISKKKQSDDQVIEANGAKVLIDAMSLPFLLGATIDYENTISSSRFIINNPNATASCGCGTSFSV